MNYIFLLTKNFVCGSNFHSNGVSLFVVSEDLDKSDEQVDGIHVDMETGADWIIKLLGLCSVHDFLSVVHQEGGE
jgi:hypothetical protein